MNDEEVLALIRREPDLGMDKLISKYSGLVWHVIRGRLSRSVFSDHDVEECAADTFMDFYLGIGRFDPDRCSIAGWLSMMAGKNAIDMLRKKLREPSMVSINDEALPEIKDGFDLEGSFSDKAERRRLIDAIKSLSSPDREIIIMKYYTGLSSKQISKQLKLSVSNVDTRTHRAIAKLRKILEVTDQ